MKALAFLWSLLACLPAIVHGHGGHESNPAPVPLAPGYGKLGFTAPIPGSYELPVIRAAADGEIVLATGEAARLHEILDGRLVVLSFIYSACSDVNGCPLAIHVLREIRAALEREPDFARDVRLVSFSFDPEQDTPETLQKIGESMGAGTAEWLFVTTPSQQALQPILDAYDQSVLRDYDAKGDPVGTFSHILRVYLIDRAKRIRNIYSVSFLHKDVVLADLRTLLQEEARSALAADGAAAALPAVSVAGPGDYKEGYESADYTTRSTSLTRRTGRPADLLALIAQPPLGLPPVSVPADNPLTAAKVELGRKLFYDRRLSFNNTFSCAMCHVPEQGFTNNEIATAVGIEGRAVRRNAPTIYNTAYFPRLFHDGREHRLEHQVWQPLLAHNEMGNPGIGLVVEKVKRLPDYQGMFERAFDGRGPDMDTIGMAIASYERTLVSANSPFDRWHFGGDEGAVDDAVKRGFRLFTGKAGCAACHSIGEKEALFTDHAFHNTGIGWYFSMQREPEVRRVRVAPGATLEVAPVVFEPFVAAAQNDLGLYEVTQDPDDRWRYRTPSLRNVALTAPYMHNGAFGTLEQVVEFYNQGGHAHEQLDPLIRPLHLTREEMADLVAFLKSLTGDNVATLVADAFAAPVGDPD
ncbi:MAG: cytochrome c peroxidase [Gammaproteobacteria bacterium]